MHLSECACDCDCDTIRAEFSTKTIRRVMHEGQGVTISAKLWEAMRDALTLEQKADINERLGGTWFQPIEVEL